MNRRALLLAALALPRVAVAQRRTVRLIVPAAPGGAIDLIGRLYAQRLGETLNQIWVVENRSGANNTLGAAEVARAAPDGQTFLVNADIHLMAPHVMRAVPYDPIADFTPVARLATAPLVLVGNPQATPEDAPALIAAMRATPQRFTFANSALGSMGHLATESFKARIGVDALVVSYRGTAPALTDVLSGQATLMIAPLVSALPHLQAGRLRGFALTDARRSPLVPSLPTMAEIGLSDMVFMLWYALWGPRDLPKDVVRRVNAAVQAIGREPAMVARQGAEPVEEAPAGFAHFIAAEAARNAEIARRAGIRPE